MSIHAQEQVKPKVVDTIVIRTQQQKAESIANLRIKDTLVVLDSAITLKERFKSFKMPSFWSKKNRFGLNFSEVAFVNWNAGGTIQYLQLPQFILSAITNLDTSLGTTL